MFSLRWRIATWYALLLVAIIAALGVAITLRFQQILRGQAQARAVATMQDIERATAPSPNSFTFAENGDSLLELENPDNLERWAATTTFIEINDVHGYTLAKSFNMGSITSFGASGVSTKQRTTTREVTTGGRPFLVYSSLLSSGNRSLIVQVGEPLDQLYQAFNQTLVS